MQKKRWMGQNKEKLFPGRLRYQLGHTGRRSATFIFNLNPKADSFGDKAKRLAPNGCYYYSLIIVPG